ncbi:hypothetical protein [Streptomyces sp. NPDC088739]
MALTDVAGRAGFSIETLAKIRRGSRVRDTTYRRLERAIGWATGAVDVVKAGGEPPLADDTPARESLPVSSAPDPQADAILAILETLPDRVAREVYERLGDRLPPKLRRP